MNPDQPQVEELSHTAEVGLRVRASTPAALYARMATAMFELIDAQPDPQAAGEWREVAVDSFDAESLMVDWLGELLYLYETTDQVTAAADIITWSPTRLTARVELRPSAATPAMHIKAVTYHQLRVVEEGDGWMAQVYFDI